MKSRKMSPKSIIAAMVLMLLMVAVTSVEAQNRVINFANIEDSVSCWQHLKDNPTDTLRLVKTEVKDNDSTVVTISVFMEGDHPCRSYNKEVSHRVEEQVPVLDPAVAAKIDSVCVETRFATDVKTNPDLRYDFDYGQVDEFTRKYLRTDGKFVRRFGRKDGLNIAGLGSFQIGDGIHAFSGKAGVMYFGGSTKSSFRYLIPVLAGATLSKYSDLAENFAGDKYWAFTSETGFYWQPVTLDRLDQLRLFIGGGVKFSWYQTDVQSHIENGITHKVGSWGSSISAMAGIYLTYRPKCQPWNFVLGIHVYQSPEIRLNQDSRRPVVTNIEAGVTYNLGEGFGNFTK